MTASIGGVGILLSPNAQRSLSNIEMILPRIIIASFNGNPATTVISCYSPTNTSLEDDVEDFYKALSSLVRNIPKHNVLVMGGVMNVQLGKENHLFTYHYETNRNGQYLQDFADENDLISLNTNFQKKPSKLWTHTYPHGMKAQLDYMLVNKKWINSIVNSEAYNTFEGVSSDHRIVSTKIRLSLS
ncbi:craniofacial development protein 2-like [Antedon mediterranea]|uniref:craniofacial development protein 2-like n=1 Tax=Antedon mediterranea TaxID=105859 RepID=UPI003AF86764